MSKFKFGDECITYDGKIVLVVDVLENDDDDEEEESEALYECMPLDASWYRNIYEEDMLRMN